MQFSLVSASERPNGNTDQISGYIEDLFKASGVTTDRIVLRDHRIAIFGTCGECNTRTAPCVIDDDMPDLVKRLLPAAGIIYVLPVHGFGPAALMQTFIERAGVGYMRFTRPLENKVGGAVVVGRRYAMGAVYNQLLNNILLNRMILIGSGYPVTLQGGTPGKALTDVEGLSSVRAMVARAIAMARLLERTPDVRKLLNTGTVNERQVDPMMTPTLEHREHDNGRLQLP